MFDFIKNIFKSKKTNQRSYAGAKNNHTTADWEAYSTSQDTEIMQSIVMLRNRARQLARDNDYAKSAIRAYQDNVIGDGVKLQSVVKFSNNKLFDSINNNIEDVWNSWKNQKTVSVSGRYNFNEIEKLIVRALVESGEIFVRLRFDNDDPDSVPLSLELIESDRINEKYNDWLQNGNEVRMGIELDSFGKPVNYYVTPYHPGDAITYINRTNKRHIIVPANEMLHIYISERPNQTRGVTLFASSMLRLKQLAGYEEAEVVSSRVSASVMGFIKTARDELPYDDVYQGERVSYLNPGTVETLRPDEDFVGFNPTRNNAGYASFVSSQLRGFSAGLGVSYETISHDYSQSNYSSSRLSLLQERDYWRSIQKFVIDNFHQKIFERFLDQAVLASKISLPSYFSNRKKYNQPNWVPRGWAWVDPQREIKANIEAIQAGLTTMSDVIAQNGGDFNDILTIQEKEIQAQKNKNIIFSTNFTADYEQKTQNIYNKNQNNQQNSSDSLKNFYTDVKQKLNQNEVKNEN